MFNSEVYERAASWVAEAGELVKEFLGRELDVRAKLSHSDLVTVIDEQVERFLVEKIRVDYPEHRIIGEEKMDQRSSDSENIWIIDPVDGTTNLINRKRDFAISVAFVERSGGTFGIVNAVMNDEWFCAYRGEGAYLNGSRLERLPSGGRLKNELLAVTFPWNRIAETEDWAAYRQLIAAARGIRVYGASTIELCEMARGRLGAYVHHDIKAYDYAASRVVLEELGCRFADWSGRDIPWTYDGPVVAASPAVLPEIVSLLKQK
ncbi:inositol monophosphatase family protein [Cohnella cellulosilytica]|uniref:Inositol monophosphatase family protein n=1 Tax=Cohnella cellulosilytica TaxID=986710 RepID=A0ABW2F5E2_9BACL